MDALIAHIEKLLLILLAAHGLAVAIVNITPTPRDDIYVAKVYRVIEILAGLITKLSKK